MDVICPLVVVVRVGHSAARVSAAQGFGSDNRVMYLLPPVTGGKVYRIPPVTSAVWEEKKAFHDEKTRRISPNAEMSARAKFAR